MTVNDKDAAFLPTTEGVPLGLTKREYFAAKALQGLLSVDTS